MFGTGLLKSLGVTFRHLLDTYIDDIRRIPSRYAGGRDSLQQGPDERGLFTIQYPEERRKLPERFRYLPMLLADCCTACGICAKVCPPQCIWIERASDDQGKPLKRPAHYTIDAGICMGCGMCAEFCPFDAIHMSQDYERAFGQRENLVYDLEALTVPRSYYEKMFPTPAAQEQAGL